MCLYLAGHVARDKTDSQIGALKRISLDSQAEVRDFR